MACSKSSSSGVVHGVSCGVVLICTGPTRSPTAAQQLARHLGDGPVGAQRDGVRATVAVLGDGVMVVEIERHDQRAGVIGCGERQRLPATRGEAQRSVLELRLGRREGDRELAQDLSVRVQRVAGRCSTPRTAKKATGCCSRLAVDAVEDDDWDLAVWALDDGRDLRTESADAIAPLASLGRVRHSRATSAGLGTDLHGCHGMDHEVVVPPRAPRHTEVRWPKRRLPPEPRSASPVRGSRFDGRPSASVALRFAVVPFERK